MSQNKHMNGLRFVSFLVVGLMLVGGLNSVVNNVQATPVTINETDAENGDWDGWAVEGDTPSWGIVDTSTRHGGTDAFYCAEGYHGGSWEYGNNYDSNLWKSFDLTTYVDASLTYTLWYEIEAGYDYLRVYISNDEFFSSDDDIYEYDGTSSGWDTYETDISRFCGDDEVYVAFRFKSDYSVVYEGAYVDDIKIVCNDEFPIADAENGEWYGYEVEGDVPSWGISTYRNHTGSASYYCAEGYHNGLHQYGNWYDSNMFRPYNLAGAREAFLTYSIWYDTELNYDYLEVWISHDNYYSSSDDVYEYTGLSNGWETYTQDISRFCGDDSVYIAFRFVSDWMVVEEGAYVDDIEVTIMHSFRIGDAENGEWDGWDVAMDQPTWDINTEGRHGGTDCWYCAEGYHNGLYQYGNWYDSNLFRTVNLNGLTEASLTYSIWHDTEANYDYLKVYISHDQTFSSDDDIYPYTGTSNGWETYEHDISRFCGDEEVHIAFRFKSDYSIVDEGAYVDDIIIDSPDLNQPPIAVISPAGDWIVHTNTPIPLTLQNHLIQRIYH